MQPHAQPRQAPRARRRIGGGGTGHHQAGMGERTLEMGALDRLVDRLAEPEIVGGEDQGAPPGT